MLTLNEQEFSLSLSILVQCQNNVFLWRLSLSEQPLSWFPSLFQYKGPLTNPASPWNPLHEQQCHLCVCVCVCVFMGIWRSLWERVSLVSCRFVKWIK